MSVYSGPEPPSGGVRRPPLAVMAPHWTQFEGVTSTECRLRRRLGLVDLRGAHPRPQLGERARHLRLHANVVRLVVARAVAREEDRRELVERQLAVGRRIRRGAVGREELLVRIALGRPVARAAAGRRSTVASAGAKDPRQNPARRPGACCARHAARARRTTRAARRRTTRAPHGSAASAAAPPRPAVPTRPRSGSPSAPARSRDRRRRRRAGAPAHGTPRQRDESALGDRLRAPAHALAALEHLAHDGWVLSSCSRSCTDNSASR